VDHFVSNKSSDLAVALGINTIRELCSRAPLCMDRCVSKHVLLLLLLGIFCQGFAPQPLPRKKKEKKH
jgi:hypothetical protein